MSYIRFGESNYYIYGTTYKGVNAVQFYGDVLAPGIFGGVMVSDDVLDVWLACLSEDRSDELQERIEHGKDILAGKVEAQHPTSSV